MILQKIYVIAYDKDIRPSVGIIVGMLKEHHDSIDEVFEKSNYTEIVKHADYPLRTKIEKGLHHVISKEDVITLTADITVIEKFMSDMQKLICDIESVAKIYSEMEQKAANALYSEYRKSLKCNSKGKNEMDINLKDCPFCGAEAD